MDFKEFIICNIDPDKPHLLKESRILECGCFYCLDCIKKELETKYCVECKICKKMIYIKDTNDLIVNRSTETLMKKFPFLYRQLIGNYKLFVTRYIDEFPENLHVTKFDFIEDEIELRVCSLEIEIDTLMQKFQSRIDRFKRKFKKLEHNVADDLKDEIRSKIDFEKYEKNLSYWKTLKKWSNHSMINTESLSLTTDNIGYICNYISFNLIKFKTNTPKIYHNEFKIGTICEINNDLLLASNLSEKSLIVLNKEFKIIRSIKYSFSFISGICTNNLDLIFVCDPSNNCIVTFNMDLTKVQNIISTNSRPTDITFDSIYLYVLFSDTKYVAKYSKNGRLLETIGIMDRRPNFEYEAVHLAVRNNKLIVLFNNSVAWVYDMHRKNEPILINKDFKISSFCYLSPYLITSTDGYLFVYDVSLKENASYKRIYERKFDFLESTTPSSIKCINETFYLTFKNRHMNIIVQI